MHAEPPDPHAAVAGLAAVIMASDGYRQAAVDHFSLQVVETYALGYLDANGSISQSQLARLMGLSTAAITGIVDRLERNGNARRVSDPADRRRKLVELTDQAHATIAESNASLARIFEQFPPELVQTLIETLPQLAEGLLREANAMRTG